MKHVLQVVAQRLIVFAFLALSIQASPCLAESEDGLLPGDNIRVTVFDSPEMTTEGRLSLRGTLRLPLIGTVNVGGMTPTAAADYVGKLLKAGGFIRKPEVTISVLQEHARQISVLGQVARPGRYPIDEADITLTDILAMAGGITPTGSDVVTVIRTRNGQTQKLSVDVQNMYLSNDFSKNVAIESGDKVFVSSAPMYYIYGEVQQVGAFRLERNTRVMHAVTVGGGITVDGTDKGIKINRRLADGSLLLVDAKLSDPVMADDVIFVPKSRF